MVGLFPDMIHTADHDGLTPLHYSIYNTSARQVEIMRALLDLQADVNCVDKTGKTPLHHAA